MNRIVFAAAILLASACPAQQKDHAAEQLVLDSGHNPGDLFQGSAKPFDLEVDFTVQDRGSMPGHFSVKWQSKDHWWSKVAVGGFEQTTIRNGEMDYTIQNSSFTPKAVQELLRLLWFDVDSPRFAAMEQKIRTIDAISATCVGTQNDQFKNSDREACFDPASHELLREDWETGAGVKNIETFAGYSALDGTFYPRKLELLKNGEEILSASVTTLESAPFDVALLVPPKSAIERRKCPGMQPPVSVKRVSPVVDRPGFEGDVTAALTVLIDGTVGDVKILRSGGPVMDNAASEAFKKFTFKPAMCGAEPVVAVIEISTTIQRR
jgi:TonB family protein